jgi:uncharacterized protein with GYD domain
MSHYLIRWQFKDATAKSLVDKPQNRTAPARKLIEGFDGQLLCYYFALGEYDGLAICEFPDTVSVAACSMKAAAATESRGYWCLCAVRDDGAADGNGSQGGDEKG